MLGRVVLSVSDYEKAKAFYLKALAQIGYELVMEFHDNVAGIGMVESRISSFMGEENSYGAFVLDPNSTQ